MHDRQSRKRAAAFPSGIRRATECLEADFADALSLVQLAAKAQMSRSHFALTFREFTGHTPHQYLLLVRLDHARKLMVQGNPVLSLAEIAAASGFFDQAHLNRHFRRFFGTTPGAFRSQQSILDLPAWPPRHGLLQTVKRCKAASIAPAAIRGGDKFSL